MIRGLGIDTVEIARIERALARHEDRFRARVFTEAERAYCDERHRPAPHYAARFAAKEAFSKAVGTGISDGLGWQDIAVRSLPSGEPVLDLSPSALALMAARGATRAHLALSHSHDSAVAVVVLED